MDQSLIDRSPPRAARLAADQVPDPVAELVALHRLLDLEGARTRQIDADVLADAAGSGAEADDAAAEERRLLDVVGAEDDGLARALPDARDLSLHGLARR